MLRARNVSFSYPTRGRDAAPVLDKVSLEIARGARIGLLGPNGSGKTTLLRLLAGMLKPDHGEIAFDERPLATLSRREIARRIAVVPQETHTTFDFSVIDMVLMGRYPHLGPFELEGAADLAIAREALAVTGTSAFETRRYSTLSGGEKQRVVIAAALAQAPDLLLLDEPTAALDLGYQFEITSLLRRLNAERGTTMLISTHDLNIIASLCTEVILFREGTILAHGRTDEVLTPSHIQALYDIDADVQFNSRAGHLTVVPVARTR
jgi:iron complex transport system ATP-binding protein